MQTVQMIKLHQRQDLAEDQAAAELDQGAYREGPDDTTHPSPRPSPPRIGIHKGMNDSSCTSATITERAHAYELHEVPDREMSPEELRFDSDRQRSETPAPQTPLSRQASEGLNTPPRAAWVEEWVNDEDEDRGSSDDDSSGTGSDNPSPARSSSPDLAPGSDSDDSCFDVDEDDPLFVTLESISGDPGDDDSSNYSADSGTCSKTALPPAFYEHPLIRRAYVQAFIAAAFHGATHDLAQYQLECSRDQLVSMSFMTDRFISGLDKMATTLRTVEKRLGLDPDEHITYYMLCNRCWASHHPATLRNLPGDGKCLDSPACDGTLFRRKQFSDGRWHRVPIKVLSASSPKEVIQRLIMRPGKLAELNKWRLTPEDAAGDKPPIAMEDWLGNVDEDHRMYDVHDGWRWNAIQAGLQRRKGGPWGIQDVDVEDLNQRFVALPNGLVLMFNLDWFRAMKRGNYSVGAIYLTVCNTPRSKCFLREETFLLAMIPGPDEPSLEQLNHVLDVFIPDLLELYRGVSMTVPGDESMALVHSYLYANVSDLPAARKASGLRGHTAKWFMCPVCKQPMHSLTDAACFDPTKVSYREEERFLKYAYRARHADAETSEEIADERGIRWSSLNLLPGWLPVTSTPTEFMHAAFLGEAKHVVQGILTVGGMLTKRSRHDQPQKKFEAWLDAMWWPGDVGRVPHGLLVGGGGKADQWRHLVSVLPVALYEAWQIDGEIPDHEAPVLRAKQKAAIKAKRIAALLKERRQAAASYEPGTTITDLEYIAQETMQRNYAKHYDTVLEWCVAIRIWGSRSISVAEARRAQDCHNQACQTWARMNCHLTPYFHLMIHFIIFILCLGPVYAWWTYVYERFNGWLAKVNHNGHKGGELEATLMRSWTKLHLIYDLILQLESLGNSKTPEDERSIQDLRKCLKGEKRPNQSRGTLLNSIAAMTAQESGDLIVFSNDARPHNLRPEGLYQLVFKHVRQTWINDTNLVPDTSFTDLGSPFIAVRVPFYSHVIVAGQRYGASTVPRGMKYQYAYINGRQAVKIMHLMQVLHTNNTGETLMAELAVVEPFVPHPMAAEMPWAVRATDLGISVWKADQLGPPHTVDVRSLTGHFALNYISYRGSRMWATMSLCHDSQEQDLIDALDVVPDRN